MQTQPKERRLDLFPSTHPTMLMFQCWPITPSESMGFSVCVCVTRSCTCLQKRVSNIAKQHVSYRKFTNCTGTVLTYWSTFGRYASLPLASVPSEFSTKNQSTLLGGSVVFKYVSIKVLFWVEESQVYNDFLSSKLKNIYIQYIHIWYTYHHIYIYIHNHTHANRLEIQDCVKKHYCIANLPATHLWTHC